MILEDLMLEGRMNCKETELERYVVAYWQQVIAAVEIWWDKYRVMLRDIESERDTVAKRLDQFLQELRYA